MHKHSELMKKTYQAMQYKKLWYANHETVIYVNSTNYILATHKVF